MPFAVCWGTLEAALRMSLERTVASQYCGDRAIGGTKIAVAAVTREGQISARLSLPTEVSRGFGWAVARLNMAIGDGCCPSRVRQLSLRVPSIPWFSNQGIPVG